MNRSAYFVGVSFVCASVLCLAISSLGGCARSDDDHSPSPINNSSTTITLYTSVDDSFAQMVIDAFSKETGIRVNILGDTEATKTTGLVTRIQAEMKHPVADVWWSSEPMGTILLDRAGALEAGAMRGSVPDDWPEALRSDSWSWVGMAMRARVIAYARDRVSQPATTLAEMADPNFKGRIGMARPQFGTTRIHMAMLADQWGIESFTAWLQAVEKNNIRLYDGNARVVQAITMGEIDIGLTDTDDVWSGQSNGWEVDLVYEAVDNTGQWPSNGPTLIPNTVAVIQGAQNPQAARQLAAYLVSPAVEEMLYQSTTHNAPVHPSLRAIYKDDLFNLNELPDYQGATEKVREAIDACEQVLISP